MHRRFVGWLAGGLAATATLAAIPSLAQVTPRAPIPYAATRPAARLAAQRAIAPRKAIAPTAAQAAAKAATNPAPPTPQRPGARLAPGAPIPPEELAAFVDGVVREAMASDHIAGTTVSIVQNGQLVLKKGYGFASLSPVRPVDPDRTLFRIGSVSKTFTWIALMKEVERGRMGVGNPVNQYLPQRLQVRDDGYSRPIAVRDLMNHSAGFEDRVLGKLFEKDPDRIRPLATFLRQERPRRVREAGAAPVYSNYGVGLAGEAVSQVAGQPFQRLIELEILRPLGLAHTTFREPYPKSPQLPEPMSDSLAADVSDGFRWSDGAVQPRDFEYLTQIAPAGSASSTAADMARYMSLILGNGTLDGVTVYSPTTAQAFRTVTQRGAPGINGWANGFMEYRLPGGFTGFGHEGETLSFNSSMVTAPELNLGVFIAANTETAGPLVSRLPELIVEHFYGGPKMLPAGDPSLAKRRGDFAGLYRSERRAYRGLEEFADLFHGATVIDVTQDGRLTTRSDQGQRTWTPAGAEGRFQATDGPDVSAFEMSGGRAVRWYAPWGGDTFKRAGLVDRPETVVALGLLALVAAVSTLIGLFLRDRRDFRQTSIQSRASALQTSTAVLWLIVILGFTLWAMDAGSDVANAVYNWPGAWLIIASACGVVATILTLAAVLALPAIWRGGRRLDSWTGWRKMRFTATALVFAALAIVLAMNGALEPWSS